MSSIEKPRWTARELVGLLIGIGLPVLVIAVLLWANFRIRERRVYLEYDSSDTFLFGDRPSRGWPFSAAHLDEAKAGGSWKLHPLRSIGDCGIAGVLIAGAFYVAEYLRELYFWKTSVIRVRRPKPEDTSTENKQL